MTRPNLLARLRNPKPADVVAVTVVGAPAATTAILRALSSVAVVTGMTHCIERPPAGQPLEVTIRVTCHPVRRSTGGAA